MAEALASTVDGARSSDRRSLLVSLITEGTYPFHEGGVSVWSDQLVRGLSTHLFRVDAITVTGTEQPIWAMPANVVGVRAHALWASSVSFRARRPCDLATKRALRHLFNSFKAPIDAPAAYDQLRRLAAFARDGRLQPALLSNDAIELALDAMARPVRRPDGHRAQPPTVADAVQSLRMLEHFLRPLSTPPELADISHVTSNGLGALLAMAAKWEWGTPIVLTEHGLYLRERYLAYGPRSMPHHQRAFMLGFFRNVVAAAYHAADVVSPGSEYNCSWEAASGADPASIQPIYNGIHAPSFEQRDGEPDEPTLVWVGRIDPLKDLKTMLRAFARVLDRLPQARLRIYGGTPAANLRYRDDCLALHERLGLGPRATFEGRVESIRDAYHAGHLVVSTSISEGFPYSVLEAMACGRAMVATDVGGVSEAVSDCGVLVAPRDDAAIAHACVELLTDPLRRRWLAQRGRARVLERFTLDLCLARYETIYDSLCDRSPATTPAQELVGGRTR